MSLSYGPVSVAELATPAGRGKAIRALLPECHLTDDQVAVIAAIGSTPEWKWMGFESEEAQAQFYGWPVKARRETARYLRDKR